MRNIKRAAALAALAAGIVAAGASAAAADEHDSNGDGVVNGTVDAGHAAQNLGKNLKVVDGDVVGAPLVNADGPVVGGNLLGELL